MTKPNKIRTKADEKPPSITTHGNDPLKIGRTSAFVKPWTDWLTANSNAVGICVMLLMLFIALFHRAVDFYPADPDDLRFLSQVAKTVNPLGHLVGDWGEAPYVGGEYGMYRPIHPISLWLVYRFFGVSAKPNQLINLGLHFANVVLLLLVMLRLQKDKAITMLYTALFMVSLYTVSPAIWVTNRAQLQVGMALLLLIYHTVKRNEIGAPLRASYVLFLSCFALLSKESGLIVPLFALLVSLHKSTTTIDRIKRGAPYFLIIGVYFLMRFLMFGAHATAYGNGGYLFGILRYETFNDLPEHLRKLSLVDNVLKNVVAIFVPVFGELGQLELGKRTLIGAIATIVLVALTTQKPTILQMYCIGIIVLNAAVHFQIYRYRSLYLAQIAFCLFLAAGPVVEAGRRRSAAMAIAAALLMVSLVQVDDYIQEQYYWRRTELQMRRLEISIKTYPGRIDPKIAKLVLEYYQ